MSKIIIKEIKMVSKDLAVVTFINKKGVTIKTERNIVDDNGKRAVNFKGYKIRFLVKQGTAFKAKITEQYKETKTKLNDIIIELENGYKSIVDEVKETFKEKGLAIPEVKVEEKKEEVKPEEPKKPQIKHIMYDRIKACVEAEIPVYLYGPAGSGKNHVLQQIAEELNLEFYFTNSVQQEYKITGFIDAGGKYHETEFYKAFKNGGLFFLDEMDASIPEVLVLLNAALANGYFEFPNGKIDAHKNFRVVSAGNTVGTGADEQYSGRLQLDQATLDRFAFIEFDYDRNIELAISGNNEELVQFIRSLRKQAQEKGINATFSYRCISMVTKLEGKLELKEVLRVAVVKGLDKDTLNTFVTTSQNKYSKALWMLRQAV